MDIAVKKVILKRFRSFPSDHIELDNPMFLVGKNGSGKSNFVDVFSFLSDAMSSSLQAVFDKRGGISSVRNKISGRGYPANMGVGFEFGRLSDTVSSGRFAFEVKAIPKYGFEVVREQCEVTKLDGTKYWYDRTKKFTSNAKELNPSLEPASLCLPIVGGDGRFAPILRALSGFRVYSIEPGKLREMQDPDSGVSLRSDGSNAASVLEELIRNHKGSIEQIYSILEAIAPNTKEVTSKKHGNKLSLAFTQRWGARGKLEFEAFNMSDGTLRAFGLLMAVYQKPAPSLLVIEEPEATIHPGALGAVLDLIRHASKTMQVVVTTHSPEVLSAKWIEDKYLRIVNWQEGSSRVLPLSDVSRKALNQHLMDAGELLRSNALEPQELFEDMSQPKLFNDIA
ncbi:MAG: AAA family ATPase [Deltaproteobacteria bacterium]|nr:AAA family ATPase [Deltaproteobacteria bacterium]